MMFLCIYFLRFLLLRNPSADISFYSVVKTSMMCKYTTSSFSVLPLVHWVCRLFACLFWRIIFEREKKNNFKRIWLKSSQRSRFDWFDSVHYKIISSNPPLMLCFFILWNKLFYCNRWKWKHFSVFIHLVFFFLFYIMGIEWKIHHRRWPKNDDENWKQWRKQEKQNKNKYEKRYGFSTCKKTAPVHTWYIKKFVAQIEMDKTKREREKKIRKRKNGKKYDEKWVNHLKAEIVWKD